MFLAALTKFISNNSKQVKNKIMEKVMELLPDFLTDIDTKKFCFQVPTKVTKLDPIFYFNFYPVDFYDQHDICFDVVLNSNLALNNKVEKKTYRFNEHLPFRRNN